MKTVCFSRVLKFIKIAITYKKNKALTWVLPSHTMYNNSLVQII